MSSAHHWSHFVKPALVGIVVLDVLALGAFAVRVDTVTRTVTTPASVASAPPVTSTPADLGVPVPVLAPAALDIGSPSPSPAVPPASPPPTSAPATPPLPRPTADPEPVAARCPIPIKEPTSSGGLQSLISFAPAFGPFKDEAFAAAAAYQPVLQLLGPILARYPEIAPKLEPAFGPFLQAFSGLLDVGYTLLEPLYAPHRQAVLAAEEQLATALAPYAQELARSPLGGCIVELQSALLDPTTTARAAG